MDVSGNRTDKANAFYKRVITRDGDNSNIKQYFMSGKLFFEGSATSSSATNPQPDYIGKCLWYYKNGNLKEEKNFSSSGEMNGPSMTYSESGKLISKANYINGVLDGSSFTEYDESGSAIKVFKEGFSSNVNDWDHFESELGRSYVEDEQLILESYSKRGNSRFIYHPIKSKNFSIEAELWHAKKNNSPINGLLFNFKDWDNYSYFYLDGNYFSVGRLNKGITEKAVDLFGTSKANTTGKNQLKILFEEGVVTYSLNSEVIYKQKAFDIDQPYIGFVIGGKGKAQFDNLNIREYGRSSDGLKDEDVRASGTAFIVHESGYLITNNHVVEEGSIFYAEFTAGPLSELNQVGLDLVFSDKNSDLALLRVADSNFQLTQALPYTIIDGIKDVGSSVYSLGYPLVLSGLGSEVKFADGKVSSRTGYDNDISSYQTSIPIQPGNSGSPMLDQDGNIVGCMNASVRETDNVSYAIKASYIKNIMETAGIEAPAAGSLKEKTLEEQIKTVSNYVAIIKVR